MTQLCPCGSAVEYSLCCHRYVSGEQVAPDPSHLMRSRYCAFVMKDADYLIRTWHPACQAAAFRDDIVAGFASTEWLGLTLFEHIRSEDDKTGYVSFVARYREHGKTGAIIERSRFIKENGEWYYIDGTRPQFGRNDACPCGSGKKFKKCCGQ
ncbi:YchJ family protein [Citrobacter rodentium]|uniref:UPF0225 protein ROD_17751 n=2 Tax=Citrobacter rodentium TaxID=67825 RepID=D2TL83_CITRI|nr:YchJ family metal-binding protein [Citrobacter rodentium]KIQ51150.1 hypothetical protein TA05_11795 [Citrobacter rodentium]QBY28335.1 hypothetical protein E2R62_05385 [Citrobacter rodentium]UHO29791.1 YchJ family protein [Citrobacter rodentium NBRC 105723 = DSM 16636]CBG88532.1 conserved hypothetical protein [Citrobacter rodentium ICC168]HAT8012671.1 hypothetical protein [Citrobacter rodentium NBRC 105723 = DSM 16636]